MVLKRDPFWISRSVFDEIIASIRLPLEDAQFIWATLKKHFGPDPPLTTESVTPHLMRLFCARTIHLCSYPQFSYSLGSLLSASRLSLFEFLEHIQEFVGALDLPEHLTRMVKDLQQGAVIVYGCFRKYSLVYSKFVSPTFTSRNGSRSLDGDPNFDDFDEVTTLYEFGWLLFLMLRERLLLHPTLSNCVKLLLCCLRICVLHFPASEVSREYEPLLDVRGARGSDVVFKMLTRDLLPSADAVHARDVEQGAIQFFQTEFSPLYQGLAKETGASLNIEKRHTKLLAQLPPLLKLWGDNYSSFIVRNGRFDDRLFLAKGRMTEGSSASESSISRTEASRFFRGPRTPLTMKSGVIAGSEAQTPFAQQIRTQWDATAWLKRVLLEETDSEPSAKLVGLWEKCSPDPLPKIRGLLNFVKGQCFTTEDCDAEEQNSIAALISKLFFSLLTAMLTAEAKKGALHERSLRGILLNDVFLRSLTVFCVHVVVPVCERDPLELGALCDLFGLKPFEYANIIDLSRRHLSMTPKSVLKVLRAQQDSIIDFHAWKPDSPLWKLLDAHQDNVDKEKEGEKTESKSERKLRQTVRTEQKPTAAVEEFKVEPKRLVLGERSIQNWLGKFFDHVGVLVKFRMEDLCERLNRFDLLSPAMQLFNDVIANHRTLLVNRHLDQLILTAVFAVAVVSGTPASMSVVLKCYRQQPQHKTWIYRKVVLDGERIGNLVSFYNDVFVVEMEKTINDMWPPSTPEEAEAQQGSPIAKEKDDDGSTFHTPKRQRIRAPPGFDHTSRTPSLVEVATMHPEGSDSATTSPDGPELDPATSGPSEVSIHCSSSMSPARELRLMNDAVLKARPGKRKREDLSLTQSLQRA